MGDKVKKFTNVYVKNLPEDVDDEQLTKLFEKYGVVTSAKVMQGDDGKMKGFGFVSFETAEGAEGCVNELNGNEELLVSYPTSSSPSTFYISIILFLTCYSTYSHVL